MELIIEGKENSEEIDSQLNNIFKDIKGADTVLLFGAVGNGDKLHSFCYSDGDLRKEFVMLIYIKKLIAKYIKLAIKKMIKTMGHSSEECETCDDDDCPIKKFKDD